MNKNGMILKLRAENEALKAQLKKADVTLSESVSAGFMGPGHTGADADIHRALIKCVIETQDALQASDIDEDVKSRLMFILKGAPMDLDGMTKTEGSSRDEVEE